MAAPVGKTSSWLGPVLPLLSCSHRGIGVGAQAVHFDAIQPNAHLRRRARIGGRHADLRRVAALQKFGGSAPVTVTEYCARAGATAQRKIPLIDHVLIQQLLYIRRAGDCENDEIDKTGRPALKVLIAGAGPGGLTAALHLHRAGIECEVFEAAAEIRQLGVGLNLLPHAVRELTVLGLDRDLAANAVATAELGYFTKRGVGDPAEPRGMAAGYKWPQFSIHRGKMQKVCSMRRSTGLARNVSTPGSRARLFQRSPRLCHRPIHRPGGNPIVHEYGGDLSIGADGIHSVVRRTFYPNEVRPVYSGRVLWRAPRGAAFLTGRSMIMAGYADRKFVCYPISEPESGRALINWVADVFVGGEAPMPRDWNRRADISKVLPWFEDWKFDWLDVPALIRGAEQVYQYPLVDRDPLPRGI